MLPTLSVVLPTHDAADWLPDTLAHLRIAIERSGWPDVQIVVVDDGSTDHTPAVLAGDVGTPAITIVRQPNGGRFSARDAGLRAATGEYVLFIDARVHAHAGSLRFVADQLTDHPERRIWNGHVVAATGSSPFSRFWEAITFVAWRRYWREPRLTSYGADEYDHYPKGTTFFLAPRTMLLEAVAGFDSSYGDLRHANDDTLMIRPLVERDRIHLSPEFSCTYHPRDSGRKFLAHSFHRGTVFVDGYFRPGTRFHRPLQVSIVVAPLAALLAIVRPRWAAGTVLGGSVAISAGAAVAGVPRRNALALGLLAPIFAVAYGAGIARGLLLRRSGRRTPPGSAASTTSAGERAA